MRRLLSHRDATIYIAGQSLSVVGDSALWLAMAIWVKILTGSNSAAGSRRPARRRQLRAADGVAGSAADHPGLRANGCEHIAAGR
jgi:hypothetical protein